MTSPTPKIPRRQCGETGPHLQHIDRSTGEEILCDGVKGSPRATIEDVNAQHLAMLGIPSDDLGKAHEAQEPKDYADPARCQSVNEQGGRCVLTEGHERPVHVRGKERWASAPTKQRPGDQALPQGGQQCVQDLIIAEMEESKRVGTERYGSPLMTFNGRRSIQDAAEEARDLHVYLTQIKAEADASREELIEVVAKVLDAKMGGGFSGATRAAVIAELAGDSVDAIMGWVTGQISGGK
jgi:hypothetical protein